MKTLCDRQELQDAFAVVSGIPPLKSTKPILQNVLMRAADDGVTFFATDNEMSARSALSSVKVSEPGVILLPAKEAAALLRELGDKTVAIQAKDGRCRIECGGGAFDLLSPDASEFPTEPSFTPEVEVEVAAKVFQAMQRMTSFAVAREETRYAINGLLLDFVDGCLRMVGTDGRRLALAYANLPSNAQRARAVVPLRALQTLAKAVPGDNDETLRIGFGKNQMRFTVGSIQLISQLLENRFPEYEQVIPKAAESTIEIDRVELERNLRRVAILASDDVRMVRFKFSGNELEMTAESSNVGKARQTMTVDMKGKGGSIAFNPDFLIDALKVCELDVVRMDMTDGSIPAKFTLGESYCYVLMPISGT
ncbi:MAG: DNA polymerase III subunit beta [Planctomycetes bacterium]|nr:DNA polymerase III subunit beta [Planctomycetota bacterium]